MKYIGTSFLAAVLLSFSTQGHALNAEDIYAKVSKSVYTIYTVNFYNKSPDSLGSAIAVTDHVLATNCHVALTGNYLGIVVNNEFKLGTIFFRDVNKDICFVEVPGMTFTPVKLRDSKDVKIGEGVFAVGNPEGLEKSISQGIISNKRADRGGYILQTDATVSFGSSGGGLFDQNAQLIGITNSIDRYTKHIAFALPSEWITQILFAKTPLTASKTVQPTNKASTGATEIKKIGTFGKANIGVYRYNDKCFFAFTGKNEFGETKGSAIWYPQKPTVLLVFPNNTDIVKNFQIMNKVFYADQDQNPEYSENYLTFANKKYNLLGVKDANNRYPLLVTKLPTDATGTLQKLPSFEIKYADGMTTEGFTKEIFNLDGFKDAMAAYEKSCQAGSKT